MLTLVIFSELLFVSVTTQREGDACSDERTIRGGGRIAPTSTEELERDMVSSLTTNKRILESALMSLDLLNWFDADTINATYLPDGTDETAFPSITLVELPESVKRMESKITAPDPDGVPGHKLAAALR